MGGFGNLRVDDVRESNLVAYWKLDAGQGSTFRDYSGNGNHGSLVSAPLWSTSVPSAITFSDPASLSFPSSGAGHGEASLSSLSLNPSSGVTVSFWTYYTAIPISTSQNMVTLLLGSGAVQIGFLRNSTPCPSQECLAVWSAGCGGAGTPCAYTTSAPALNTWHHVAYTYGGGTSKLYVDGSQIDSRARTPSNSATTTMYLSTYDGTNEPFSSGTVDDVRIYNTALSLAQVKSLAAGRAAGTGGTATITLDRDVTVGGTLSVDSGTLAMSSYNLTAASTDASKSAYVYAGTLSNDTGAATFQGGLAVLGGGTVKLTGNGTVAVGTGKSLVIDGTLQTTSTANVPTIQVATGGTSYAFTVGSTSTSTPTLNIASLNVRNTDTNGLRVNSDAASVTTFTRFDNLSFASGTGNYLLWIYSQSLALQAAGLTFDGSTTKNVYLQGNGTGDGETKMFIGGSCSGHTPCESYDLDDDSSPEDGTGDTGNGTGDEAVVQWLEGAYGDTAGAIEGFPTQSFRWDTFEPWKTYVAYNNYSGTIDRIYVRNNDGTAAYSWDLPDNVGDFKGTPRWNNSGGIHYVYVLTTLGYVYNLLDSGSSFSVVSGWPYRNGSLATATSPLGLDASNLYWAGNDGAGAKKMFSLTQAMVLNGTRTVVADVLAAPAIASVSSTTYLFTGTNGKIYRTPTDLGSELTSTQSTSTVYGRLTVLGGNAYFAEDIGKLWALTDAALATSWSYQDTDATRHPGGCSANSQCTVRNFYVEPTTKEVYFGDKDGHVYVLDSTGTPLANYPFARPGTSSDEFQTAPLYQSGVIVIGATTGKLFVIDRKNGSNQPELYKTYNFGSAISTVGYSSQATAYVVATADGKLYYVDRVTDPTSGNM